MGLTLKILQIINDASSWHPRGKTIQGVLGDYIGTGPYFWDFSDIDLAIISPDLGRDRFKEFVEQYDEAK